MGRNSTFKKRRHSYKGALALEIRVRGIVEYFEKNLVLEYSCTIQSSPCASELPRPRAHAGYGRIARNKLQPRR